MNPRLAVLISGDGSNLQALIDAIRMHALDAEIAVVVSNRADAYGLERARKADIPAEVHLLKPYLDDERGRREYDADLAELLLDYDPDWVILAGWMHILSRDFLDEFEYRVVNLHPALPGKFPGAHAIQDAFAAFQRGEIKETGVMVHLVPDERVDVGPVIASRSVPIYPRDTLEGLTNRIHGVEHQVLVYAIQRLIEGDEV
ncbi:MAG: phosphoribosylglycinamide formyltransferase [Caldilineaceae bacterium]|nr:phosphoribosylglycinamide formyltransferase [Caldilineaceae bacterium]MCB9139455.1 phosphoribosylglycinamide formyltransferase [Caldilineaceae bacterium]